MSQNDRESATLDGFQQKLDELRWRIDLLPERRRPHLHKMANVVEQQCQDKPDGANAAGDVVSDLRLLEKHVKADSKAARRRARKRKRTRQDVEPGA